MQINGQLKKMLGILCGTVWSGSAAAEVLDLNSLLPAATAIPLDRSSDLWTALSLGLVLVVAYGIAWVVSLPVARLSREEEQLIHARQENRYMKHVLDGMSEGVLVTDRQGQVLLTNERFRQWVNGDDAALAELVGQVQDTIAQVLATGGEVRQSISRPTGDVQMARVQPIVGDGAILGALVWFESVVEEGVLQIGFGMPEQELTLDRIKRWVLLAGRRLELTTTEFALLAYLAERRGTVQSREELLQQVWGHEHPGNSRTVDTHVRRLREKLGDASPLIETVRGKGYRFRPEAA